MGLFSRKKKEEKKELPPLKFPEIPDKIPTYESSIKEAVQKEAPAPEFPKIESKIEPPKIPSLPPRGPPPKLKLIEQKIDTMPHRRAEEKVLFIKVDKYEEVIDTLNAIKTKLSDTERTLMRMEQEYNQEERQIDIWKRDLEQIKQKIASIDKKLYTI